MEQSNKYRKKPVVIEAFHFTKDAAVDEISWPDWLQDALDNHNRTNGLPALWVDFEKSRWMCGTLEGPHEITFNDWIIQDDEGRIYPCKPDIFEATYEPV